MLFLREIRKNRNLSQKDLASAASISQGHISELENGKASPSLEVLIALADALHCSLDELAGHSADT